MKKFMMTINREVFHLLEAQAKEREVSVQELVRAVVLPYWFKKESLTKLETQSSAEPAKLLAKTKR